MGHRVTALAVDQRAAGLPHKNAESRWVDDVRTRPSAAQAVQLLVIRRLWHCLWGCL